MKLFVVFAIKEILMKQGYVLIVWIEKEAGVMRQDFTTLSSFQQ